LSPSEEASEEQATETNNNDHSDEDEDKPSDKGEKTKSGVKFTNVLLAAFLIIDPKSLKKYS